MLPGRLGSGLRTALSSGRCAASAGLRQRVGHRIIQRQGAPFGPGSSQIAGADRGSQGRQVLSIFVMFLGRHRHGMAGAERFGCAQQARCPRRLSLGEGDEGQAL
jgi:hypothetical protein